MRPMLAVSATYEDLVRCEIANFIVQPKLDGVRAIVIEGVVMSRNLKPIPNQYIQDTFGRQEFNGLDGELIVGEATAPDVYRTTVSGVRTAKGTPDVRFWVFDDYELGEASYLARLQAVEKTVALHPAVPLVPIPQHSAYDSSILELEEHYLAEGYEGIIVRDPNAKYRFGRSTLKTGELFKLKRFADAEAVVLKVMELCVNENEATTNELGYQTRSSHQANMRPAGMLGALEVKDIKTGVIFSIGSGFTEEQRLRYWHNEGNNVIGKIVTYQHFPIGVKDRPRFPTFKGFREV